MENKKPIIARFSSVYELKNFLSFIFSLKKPQTSNLYI